VLVEWVEQQLGSGLASVLPQVGGMSPGPAVRLITRDGRRAFLKAVAPELNPDSPGLFRHEALVLSYLPPSPYRVGLQAVYDDGDWVALLLDDIDGRHPDLGVEPELAAVEDVVQRQAHELTPPPAGLQLATLADNAALWSERWSRVRPQAPAWVVDRFSELHARVESLPERMPLTTLCHWDVREDNLLVKQDGSVVIYDWGMSRIGPPWADRLLLALSRPGIAKARAVVAQQPEASDLIVDTVLGLAGSQLVRSAEPSPPGLPNVRQFQATDAQGLFALAHALLDTAQLVQGIHVAAEPRPAELIGGREKRDIVVVPHDPDWPSKFAQHADRIRRCLGGIAVRVDHIGSTAVPGLAAKPIIDIDVSVRDVEDDELYLRPLAACGYELRVREPDHRMVRTPALDVQVHICQAGSQWERRHLLFRDWLIADDSDRAAYAALKTQLAGQTWNDMNEYADAKGPLIAGIMARAEAWAASSGWTY
jgi:GrpB-like predicted nucleotidyltransferase (UPF0157 family)